MEYLSDECRHDDGALFVMRSGNVLCEDCDTVWYRQENEEN